MKMTVTAALKALRLALATGNVTFRKHAFDMIDADVNLNVDFVAEELAIAAARGDVDHNRSVPGAFVAHGDIVLVSFVVRAPGVVVVTVFVLHH